MHFVILRLLKHNELGMFHSYRRLNKERAKQRAINFDGDVVDRVFPAAKDDDNIELELKYETDEGVESKLHRIKRQEKNWRLEGNCPKDKLYDFVDPGCLFAMVVDSGTKPAKGAWAVYPQDHEVTNAIVSHAESSQLTAQSMIALFGSEGGYTLDLLCASKPELFGTPTSAYVPPSAKKKTRNSDSVHHSDPVHLPPNPRRLVRILAAVGHSMPSAVADIVDNSISADATEINITFREPDQGHGRWMAISDNGKGMDSDHLAEAMRIGSDAEYESGDLGKFGYGLKGASWSQAESFTVISKVAGEASNHLSWNAETMDNWEASRAELEPWIASVVSLKKQGTCVFWRDMRPPKQTSTSRGIDPYTAEVRDLARHLGLVFHRFIDGQAKGRKAVQIKINGDLVISNNPIGHSLACAYDKKPIRVPTATKDAYVDVQAFLLPSEGEVKEYHGNDADAAREDLERLGMYGRRNESQGLYVYRNDRLIQWGGWHQMWNTSDEKTKLARVMVDFSDALDDQFSVNISKQKVALPHQLQEHIKKLAEEARKDSRKKYLDDKPKPKTGKNSSQKAAGSSNSQNIRAKNANDSAKGDKDNGGTSSVAEVPVRKVRNAKFSWKIARSMTGQEEIQISENEVELQSLFDVINDDPDAINRLSEFLKRLDSAGVQTLLADARAST
jgi:hypothetical protein